MFAYDIIENKQCIGTIEIPDTPSHDDIVTSLIAGRIVPSTMRGCVQTYEHKPIDPEEVYSKFNVFVEVEGGVNRNLWIKPYQHPLVVEGKGKNQKLKLKAQKSPHFEYFYGGPFSQWSPVSMRIGDILYSCAEEYMMICKAMTFHDLYSCIEIMGTDDPMEMKGIGRRVRGYVGSVWDDVAPHIVYRATLAKFNQHKTMWKYLMETEGKLLVEASPTDVIWGVGLDEYNPLILDPSNWRGDNLLGRIITQVREDMISGKVTGDEVWSNPHSVRFEPTIPDPHDWITQS